MVGTEMVNGLVGVRIPFTAPLSESVEGETKDL